MKIQFKNQTEWIKLNIENMKNSISKTSIFEILVSKIGCQFHRLSSFFILYNFKKDMWILENDFFYNSTLFKIDLLRDGFQKNSLWRGWACKENFKLHPCHNNTL